MQAGGLAAVWAEENTREAIVAAFKRREVYATTGPRIRVHLTASNSLSRVPMGGVLDADPTAPTIHASALKDPLSGNLDRMQIVKGWREADGQTYERIYEAAWSGDRVLTEGGRLPPVGDTVDRATGQYRNSIGAHSLEATWTDPDYNPAEAAFYYVRVLEIPTPRHALLDAIALGLEKPSEGPEVIQERAYSSPVWTTPAPLMRKN